MTKVKVFVYRRRRRQGHDNSSPDFRHVELKIGYLNYAKRRIPVQANEAIT